MSDRERDHNRAMNAKHWLAKELREKTTPQEARILTGGKSDKIDSKTAERMARETAEKAKG